MGSLTVNKVLRCAQVRRSALVALFLVSGLLLLPVMWRSFKSRGGQPQREDTPLHFSERHGTTTEGIDPDSLHIKTWHVLENYKHDLAQFETVFWEPDDTTSLRGWLINDDRLSETRVLEIGTGTGLIAIFCAEHGAFSVVATDINPQAVANARYNAELFGLTDRVEVRLVSPAEPGPFAVVASDERFDLIISNPPWEDLPVEEVAAHALYDPGFALLDGLLANSQNYLRSDGKLLLAYGARTAVQRILATAPGLGWQVHVHDDRTLLSLPEVFVPGILLELTRKD